MCYLYTKAPKEYTKASALLIVLFPEAGHKEKQYGKDFQTSDQHIETHEPFAGVVDVGEVGGGAGSAHAGANVAEHGYAAAQAGFYVVAQQGQYEGADDYHNQIDEDVGQCAAYILAGYYLSGYAYAQHCPRMEQLDKFVQRSLGADKYAQHFYTASGTAGTGAYAHEYEGGHPEGRSPTDVVEVLARKSCTGDDGRYVEEGGAEILPQVVQHVFGVAACLWRMEEQQEEHQNEEGYDIEEGVHLLVAQEYLCAADAQVVVEGEVDTGEEHEDGADVFYVRGMEEADAGCVGAESACGQGGHGMANGVEEVHGSHPEEEGADDRQQDVDGESPARRSSYFWPKPVQFQPGHLGRIYVAVLHFVDGNKGYGEYDDSQSAYPVHHTAPEAQAVGKSVYVGYNGGAGGGESAHGLEEGVGRRHAQMQDEGHHAYGGEEYPGKCHNKEAVCARHALSLFLASGGMQGASHGKCDKCAGKEGQPVVFGIDEGNY